jgi:hypothetical protein
MKQCLNEIQQDIILNYEEIKNGKIYTSRQNPTKKKEFLGVALKIGKNPMFQFYINEHFIGTYVYNSVSKKWKVD